MKVTNVPAVGFGLATVKEEGALNPDYVPPTPEQAAHRANLDRQSAIMHECLDERERQVDLGFDATEDDTVPIYAWGKKINHQLNQASGGHGPFRKRYLRIMAIAMAALESIDRKEPL